MQTIILPGFSSKNQVWADETRSALNTYFPTQTVSWHHWQTGQPEPNWIDYEIEKIIAMIGNHHTNLLAKSIGTAIAAQVISLKSNLINKLILCGVPILDLKPTDQIYYTSLKKILPEQGTLFSKLK